MPFFSIIIPVYNAEKYIERCVKSVLVQTFKDWELIIVDDGSTDDSRIVCSKLKQGYSNIRVLYKINGGAASARNLGVKEAIGNYILFIDSDDYWEGEKVLSQLEKQLRDKSCDVCLYGCYDEFADSKIRVKSRGDYEKDVFASKNKGKILTSLVSTNQFPGSCWIMSVKRELLTSNNITFEEKNRAEDIGWILSVVDKSKNFKYINAPIYVYTKGRWDSITGTANLNSVKGVLKTTLNWNRKLKEEKNYEIYQALNSYLAYEFMTAVLLYDKLPKNQKREMKQIYVKSCPNMKRIIEKRTRIACLIYRVFGLTLTSKIFTCIRKTT